jgi:hypothetical protein
VIVEAGLADRHDLWMPRKLNELRRRHVGLLRRMMRMRTHRAEDIAMRLDDLPDLGELAHARRDRNDHADACLGGAQ